LHRELSERNVDLLVGQRIGPLADEQLGFEKLYDDPFVVVASAQNPWARRRSIKLAELMNELWALPPPESALASVIMEAFRASGLDYPRATVSVFAHEARISLLETGRFLSIFSKSRLTLPTERPQLKVLPVEAPLPSRPVGLLYLKNRTLSPATQLFFHHAREVAKPLVRKMR
jgi:DNA-binding transcriptional LysR family regulator